MSSPSSRLFAALAAVVLTGAAATVQAQEGAPTASSAMPAQVCLTNGCLKTPMAKMRNSAEVTKAISAGSLRGVLDAGGSAVDLANAWRARCQSGAGGRGCQGLDRFAPGSESFIIGPNGNLALTGQVANLPPGANMTILMTDPELQGVEPPAGTPTFAPPPVDPACVASGDCVIRRQVIE